MRAFRESAIGTVVLLVLGLRSMKLSLYQLADSAFPVGGFVYSMGMESAIKSKLLTNQEELTRYLKTYIDQVLSFEFPFLNAAYESYGNKEKWKEIYDAYHAMLMNPMLEKSSLVLGKNWLKIMEQLYPTVQVSELRNELKKQGLSFHFTLVFGALLAAINTSLEEAKELFLFAALRDQINALTRLGVVGPTGGQTLLNELLKYAEISAENLRDKPYENARKSAYIMEIIQLNHHEIYSKLFQN